MITMKQQLEALIRLCTAEKESERLEAKKELMRMMEQNSREETDPETVVRELMLELGAPDHLSGHAYMVEALLVCLEDRLYINNITFGLYPQVAAKFDTTAARVERAMRHLIEVTWNRGNGKVLERYFGNTISGHRGKPTNSEFIARMTNVLRQQLKKTA